MKYYLVKCKFGHVGRNHYLPLDVPVKAHSPKEVSEHARNVAGVKRNHKDWCLQEPIEINQDIYEKAYIAFKSDIYFEKKTRSRINLFQDRLVEESTYTRINGNKTNKITYKKKRNMEVITFKRKKQKVILNSKIREQINEIITYASSKKISVGGEKCY
jgi:hypothetical protein